MEVANKRNYKFSGSCRASTFFLQLLCKHLLQLFHGYHPLTCRGLESKKNLSYAFSRPSITASSGFTLAVCLTLGCSPRLPLIQHHPDHSYLLKSSNDVSYPLKWVPCESSQALNPHTETDCPPQVRSKSPRGPPSPSTFSDGCELNHLLILR